MALIPVVRTILVCEEIQVDPMRPHRLSLVGVVHSIRSKTEPPYPVEQSSLSVYLQLTGCRGPVAGWIQVVHADTEQELFVTTRQILPLPNDPLQVRAISFTMRKLVFPIAGLYWVRFQCEGQILAEYPILLR